DQHGDNLQLKFDHEAIQSEINRQQPQQLVMQNLQYLMGILLFMPEPENILLLGVGGGSMVHFLRHHFPQSHITGVELDAKLLETAHDKLLLPRADDQLTYCIQDARDHVTLTREKYDLIVVDIFDGSQSPDWILELEFTQELKRCLRKNGGLTYNLLIDSEKKFSQFYQMLRQVFDHQTLCLDTEDYENILVYALNFKNERLSMPELMEKGWDYEEKLKLPFRQILAAIYDINPVDSGII
ncbi:MAG: fused MFS/spermidine synthase, partial [Proteobacteria bacterium]|nr:fused MFS/spermidine synthase [Pseudomonadota bacterium]